MTDILEPRPPGRDQPALISDPDTPGRDSAVIRATPFLAKSDKSNKYALSVSEILTARLVSAVETLVEQNETIIMYLESMDS